MVNTLFGTDGCSWEKMPPIMNALRRSFLRISVRCATSATSKIDFARVTQLGQAGHAGLPQLLLHQQPDAPIRWPVDRYIRYERLTKGK